jgi:hypothetical protein
MIEFKLGDKVLVKSHNAGPIVVESVTPDAVVCTLHDGTSYAYPHGALELVDAPEDSEPPSMVRRIPYGR